MKLFINIYILLGLCFWASVSLAQSSRIEGQIFVDADFNCQQSGFENISLNQVVVSASKGSEVHYTTADSNGFYALNVDTGTYYISMQTPSPYWFNCNDSTPISFAQPDTINLNLGNWNLLTCPMLRVGVSTPSLQPCQPSTYVVSYCNTGTANATNAYVEITLDSFLTLDSASIPVAAQVAPRRYRFNLGTVPFGECDAFELHTSMACGTVLTGQTHCVQAHIFPDSTCVPIVTAWDQSDIDVTVICEPDTIKFRMENVGTGNMNTQRGYFVAEDEIMLKAGSFQLNSGQTQTIAVPLNGLVYHFQAQQDPVHPLSPFVAIGFEGCGVAPDTTGTLLQYPLENYLPFVDYDCQQNVTQVPSAELLASPQGYGLPHYIPSYQPLEYHIRFQNKGTQPIQNLLIVDSLALALDPLTTTIVSTSHAYRWTLDDQLLKISMDSINLTPDEEGFAHFLIYQKQDNPDGTIIYNQADLYFDGQLNTSNQTFHEIKGDAYTGIITHQVLHKSVDRLQIRVFPNPVYQGTAHIRVVSPNALQQLDFRLWNAQGQLIEEKMNQPKNFEFSTQKLPNGVYFYSLSANGKQLGSGQIIINK